MSWLSISLSDLQDPSVPPKVLKSLSDSTPSIVTIGDLVAWQEEKGDLWLRDIKGLGPAGVELLRVACTNYRKTKGEL